MAAAAGKVAKILRAHCSHATRLCYMPRAQTYLAEAIHILLESSAFIATSPPPGDRLHLWCSHTMGTLSYIRRTCHYR